MSSILEALRELESDRARANERKTTTVTDAPREPERSFGAFIPLLGGLAVGVVVFGAYVWSTTRHGALPETATAPVATAPAMPATAAAPADVPDAPHGPEWLERAEAPRARVTPPPATSPPRPAAAAASAAATPAPTPREAAPEPVLPKTPNTRIGGDQSVQLEGISYSAIADDRTATLVVNGRRATLRQRESLGGVEVQLIMDDGVYLQRGSEVFFVSRRH